MTTTRITLRVPLELHSQLAQANDRTLTAEALRAFRLYLAGLPPARDPTPAGSSSSSTTPSPRSISGARVRTSATPRNPRRR